MQFVCSQHAKDTEVPLKKGKPNNEMIVMFFIKIYDYNAVCIGRRRILW